MHARHGTDLRMPVKVPSTAMNRGFELAAPARRAPSGALEQKNPTLRRIPIKCLLELAQSGAVFGTASLHLHLMIAGG